MDTAHENTFFGMVLPFDVYSALFTVIVLVGGLVGFFKGNSTPSLIAGVSFAVLLSIGTYYSSKDATNIYFLLSKLFLCDKYSIQND